MPYIPIKDRAALDAGGVPETPGELNYRITQLLRAYLTRNGKTYDTIQECISSCEGAKLEFYRRVAAPYEDTKILQNGDVY